MNINFKIIIKILAYLLIILAGFMIIPAGIALYLGETHSAAAFLKTIVFTVPLSTFLIFTLKNVKPQSLSTRDGFLLVTLCWIFASLTGAMPFYLSGGIPSFTDAYFEAISGFSTTGASILTDIEALPSSLLFWRSLTQWLGGMGIVVLAVAVLPILGIGGLQLIKAEAPGPSVDRITPRIAETAKILWLLYLGLTAAQVLLLRAGGMPLFDSFIHTFSTLATGGFSSKGQSIGHYESAYIHGVITLFMFLAGVSFILHFRLITGRVQSLFRESEFKTYTLIFLTASILIALNLSNNYYNSFSESFKYASFQAASILTTTGYATADYSQWPNMSKIILFTLMFVGGCAGSTGGGIKVIRLVILLKQAINEMKLLLHPGGVFTLRINGAAVRKNTVYAVAGFFFLYIAMLLLTAFIVASSGENIETSFTAALATVGNIGPGFAKVGPAENYAFFKDYVKWFLSFAMLAGRLELYTVFVIFTRRFWDI